LLSSPKRKQIEQKETKKKQAEKEEPPESTSIIVGFPFSSASFHSKRKKLKRGEERATDRRNTPTEGKRTNTGILRQG